MQERRGGEFYTPQQVSKLLAHLCLDNFNGKPKNAYDPACGSSSLLLQVGKIFKKQYNDSSIELDGQERNLTTYRLSRMNMFLHGINYSNFDIQQDDTLLNPKHLNNKYDIIVSNPPYSIHWDTDNKPTLINDERYSGPGVLAPKTKADFAFILHVLYQLSPTGIAAIICFPGIFYRSGAEQKIRKYLVDGNYVQALISLPNNLFFGTSIDTVVLVLKKNKTNNDVLFINASDFYNKVTNKNDLSDEHIQQILDIYAQHIDGEYSKVVNNEIIKDNNYDLSVNKYIPKIVKKEEIDIKQLNEEIKNISERNQQLRFDIESLIKEIEMTKFEQLLNEMCPDGCEYKELGLLVDIDSGIWIKKTDLIDNGKYIAISGGTKPFGLIDKWNRAENTITIVRCGCAGYVSYQTEKFCLSDACYSLTKSNIVDTKFLFYYLKSIQNKIYSLTKKAIPDRLNKENLKSLQIPIPPLSVQTRIVEILDKFSALIDSANQGIPKEIELRKKQYEYYLNKLLAFKEK